MERRPDWLGSLARKRESNIHISEQLLYATVDGAIGSLMTLDPETYALLLPVQRAMAKAATCPGDFSYSEYVSLFYSLSDVSGGGHLKASTCDAK